MEGARTDILERDVIVYGGHAREGEGQKRGQVPAVPSRNCHEMLPKLGSCVVYSAVVVVVA